MTTISIFFISYIFIGIILTVITEYFTRKLDGEFFSTMTDKEYLIYHLENIFMWLPDLLEFTNRKDK